jgi:hypothetical protein
MSKLSREEIDVIWTKNWFKNRVLDELKSTTNSIKRKQAELYYEKNKCFLKDKPFIYVMINIDKVKRKITSIKRKISSHFYIII